MGNEKHGKKKKTGLGGRNLQNIIFLNIKKKKIKYHFCPLTIIKVRFSPLNFQKFNFYF